MHRLVIAGLFAVLTAGCSWVQLEPGAENVLELPESRLTPSCERVTGVTVSVADRVGALERHAEEVEEDLSILARNHAAKRNADTVVPTGPVVDGERQYGVYRCEATTNRNTEPREDDGVEVLPYDDGN